MIDVTFKLWILSCLVLSCIGLAWGFENILEDFIITKTFRIIMVYVSRIAKLLVIGFSGAFGTVAHTPIVSSPVIILVITGYFLLLIPNFITGAIVRQEKIYWFQNTYAYKKPDEINGVLACEILCLGLMPVVTVAVFKILWASL